MAVPATRPTATALLADALSAARNADGGWGYYTGKTSRLEPTVWIALGPSDHAAPALRWLQSKRTAAGWCPDDPQAPINYTFNGLALLALLNATGTSAHAEQLAHSLTSVKGLAFGPSEVMRQDNSLQAWSWVDGTFSWVEPTACCLLALKRARQLGVIAGSTIEARIAVGEQMLADRACDGGGWNYGNAHVFDKNLAAHGPTTALTLLALQDRRDLPAVKAGLTYLEAHAESERSGLALGLASICLKVFGRHTASVGRAITAQQQPSLALGNAVTLATLLIATSDEPDAVDPFRLVVRS